MKTIYVANDGKQFDNVTQMDNFISICLFCKQIDLVT